MSQGNAPRFDAEPRKRGWFGRNWLWFVPTVVILPILVCGGCFAGIAFSVFGVIKGSDAYQLALERVQQSADVQAQLGQPIEDATVFPFGNIKFNGGESEAALFFSVKGPNGGANVVVEGETTGGAWHFDKLVVTCDSDGTQIDLSDEHVPSADDAPAFAPEADDSEGDEAESEEKKSGPAPALEINVE